VEKAGFGVLETLSRDWYDAAIMSNPIEKLGDDICARVKKLGYTTSSRMRLYGEEFEVISEPFAEADGVAVRVKSRKSPQGRVLSLPATVVQSVHGRGPAKVA